MSIKTQLSSLAYILKYTLERVVHKILKNTQKNTLIATPGECKRFSMFFCTFCVKLNRIIE